MVADGAEWIWNAAAEQFPGHRGVLDIFHASEHVAATANVLHGPGTAASRAWFEAARTALLGDGWYGVQEQIGRTLTPDRSPTRDAPRSKPRPATWPLHSTRLNYRLRLARGEPIGSGMIEGILQTPDRTPHEANRRTLDRPNANRMAELCSLTYSEQWTNYWLAG